jgi:hypothetical protein
MASAPEDTAAWMTPGAARYESHLRAFKERDVIVTLKGVVAFKEGNIVVINNKA